MMLLVAGLTALISVNGAVAALLPVVVVIAVRLGRSPSQLLMPLVFGAHAGSMLALTGTPVNVIVTEAAVDYGDPAVRLLRVRARRRPAASSAAIAIVVLFGERLLPTRTAARHPGRLQPPRAHPRRPVRARVDRGAGGRCSAARRVWPRS